MSGKSQSGFGIIEMILGIVVVGVVVLVGLHIYQTQQLVGQANDSSLTGSRKTTATMSTVTPIPAINNSNDLQAVSQTLDAPVDDAAALNDLDAQLNF